MAARRKTKTKRVMVSAAAMVAAVRVTEMLGIVDGGEASVRDQGRREGSTVWMEMPRIPLYGLVCGSTGAGFRRIPRTGFAAAQDDIADEVLRSLFTVRLVLMALIPSIT